MPNSTDAMKKTIHKMFAGEIDEVQVAKDRVVEEYCQAPIDISMLGLSLDLLQGKIQALKDKLPTVQE